MRSRVSRTSDSVYATTQLTSKPLKAWLVLSFAVVGVGFIGAVFAESLAWWTVSVAGLASAGAARVLIWWRHA